MRPTIEHTELFSYLVTRHTGRTVRTSIEERIAGVEASVLAVLDLHHVPLIDFSCADEVVAKLVMFSAGSAPHRRFVLFRGIADHHMEPIESALSRQGLAAAAETADGEPLLMGALDPGAAAAWREIGSLGYAGLSTLAERLEISIDQVTDLVGELESRALVLRDGERYVSLGRVLRDADPDSAKPDEG